MHQCQNCGGFVTRDFARVFGDNRDAVHGCPDCEDATAILGGRAAGH